MKRLLWLYPKQWRTRYGAEFQALLDDSRSGWRSVFDIVRAALLLRIDAHAYTGILLTCALPRQATAIEIVDRANSSYDPIFPNRRNIAIAGAGGGLLLGGLIAALKKRLSDQHRRRP